MVILSPQIMPPARFCPQIFFHCSPYIFQIQFDYLSIDHISDPIDCIHTVKRDCFMANKKESNAGAIPELTHFAISYCARVK